MKAKETKSKLILEVNSNQLDPNSGKIQFGNSVVLMTPAIGEDYWQFRVKVSETQSVIGFPKFFTIGIGFAKETDWNTNLPYSSSAEIIFRHIKHNKGSKAIKDEDCIEAIRMIQAAAKKIKG